MLPHWGHLLIVGPVRLSCARLLSRRAFEVFLLGTAMSLYLFVSLTNDVG